MHSDEALLGACFTTLGVTRIEILTHLLNAYECKDEILQLCSMWDELYKQEEILLTPEREQYLMQCITLRF